MFAAEKNLFAFILIAAMFLGGCGANHYSIHRTEKLDPAGSSTAIAVDAKQRFLLSNVVTRTKGTTTETFRRYCIEPSPDVFTVLSQAGSGSGTFGQTADPKSLNIILQAAFSSSEAGSIISRTQTINMLKEMMYRTCESYLNGQIDEDQYPIIAARNQRIMASILAIEQLTGAVSPKSGTVATPASTSTSQSTDNGTLSNLRKTVEEKKTALDNARKEFDQIDNPKNSCSETLNDTNAEKLNTCKEKKDNIGKAEKDLTNAQLAHYNALNDPGNRLSSSSATAGPSSPSQPSQGPDNQIDQDRSQAMQGIAKTVENIVLASFKQEDENAFFCYGIMKARGPDDPLSEKCADLMGAKVESETRRLKRQAEIADTLREMDELKKSNFDRFWDKIKNQSDQVDQTKLQERIKAKLSGKPSHQVEDTCEKMKKETTKEEIRKLFVTLPNPIMTNLAND